MAGKSTRQVFNPGDVVYVVTSRPSRWSGLGSYAKGIVAGPGESYRISRAEGIRVVRPGYSCSRSIFGGFQFRSDVYRNRRDVLLTEEAFAPVRVALAEHAARMRAQADQKRANQRARAEIIARRIHAQLDLPIGGWLNTVEEDIDAIADVLIDEADKPGEYIMRPGGFNWSIKINSNSLPTTEEAGGAGS